MAIGACHGSHACRRDSDCNADQVCFADGCGDPGQGIRVEVSPESSAGRLAQDLALDDVHARQDIVVGSPGVLQGSIRFLDDGNPPQTVPYSNSIAIRGRGESEIIPGVTRTFDVTLGPGRGGSPDSSSGGAFSLPVNAGVYSITANTLDPLIPPATTQTSTAVRPGSTSIVDFLLGRLTPEILIRVMGPNTPSGLAIQAFSDPVAARPLSQRLPAGPGVTLQLSPAALLNSSFVVQVAPLDPLAVVPQKTFGPFPTAPTPPSLTLEMGDFGEPVAVTGRIVDSQGVGIPGATVYVDGRVGGGGTFRSQGVLADAAGRFSLNTLRSAPDSTVWAIPSAQSASGILRLRRAIEGTGTISIGDLVCPDKVIVQGKIFKSDETSTDVESSFSLKLDPATYRLDFIPSDQLPRASRFVAIAPDPNPSGGYRPIQLSDFALSKGRRITGNVLAPPSPNESARVAPFTSLRFFRLINDLDGRPSSVLLAETVSDARGAYSVSLPSR